MNSKTIRAALAALALLGGCSNADLAHVGTWNGSQHVVLYAASGSIIGQWDSDGLVQTEDRSDGWYFKDKATGKLVRISGTVLITQN
jgi:hypothetical protein